MKMKHKPVCLKKFGFSHQKPILLTRKFGVERRPFEYWIEMFDLNIRTTTKINPRLQIFFSRANSTIGRTSHSNS